MKKLFVLFSFLFIFASLSAQYQIPNGSFYYWSSSYAPDGWGTWASAIGPLNPASGLSLSKLAYKDTAAGDYLHDSATLALTVDTVNLPSQGLLTLAGFASLNGAYYSAPPNGFGLGFGYLPYVLRPDTLFFDYKYIPAPGSADTALVLLSLTRFDTLSHTRWQVLLISVSLNSAPLWQHSVGIPLSAFYNVTLPDTLRPDSMQVIIYSSVSSAPTRGTALWIDSLHFDASVNPPVVDTTGILDIHSLTGVSVYPNPATDLLQIAIAANELGCEMKLFDATGKEVYESKLEKQVTPVDTRRLPAGIYTLRIYSTDRITVYRGAVSIFH